jgi:hypothetical protein
MRQTAAYGGALLAIKNNRCHSQKNRAETPKVGQNLGKFAVWQGILQIVRSADLHQCSTGPPTREAGFCPFLGAPKTPVKTVRNRVYAMKKSDLSKANRLRKMLQAGRFG